MKKNKKIEEQKLYEKYSEPEQGLKNWNKGGFIKDDKYIQPVKHKLFR